jgi:serine/threonine protein kinase
VTDFGLSRILTTSGFTTKTQSGTQRYMSPELFPPCDEDVEESAPRLTMASDIWAFSMTILEVRRSLDPLPHLCKLIVMAYRSSLDPCLSGTYEETSWSLSQSYTGAAPGVILICRSPMRFGPCWKDAGILSPVCDRRWRIWSVSLSNSRPPSLRLHKHNLYTFFCPGLILRLC